MHARKMAALMQATTGAEPEACVLLRVERDAGHGVGKPLDKQVEDLADQYSFFASRLGLRRDPPRMVASPGKTPRFSPRRGRTTNGTSAARNPAPPSSSPAPNAQ